MGDIKWKVLSRELMHVADHREQAGLQFADVVASAFFKACDHLDTKARDTQYAKLLRPRMASDPDTKSGQIAGFGVKLFPKCSGISVSPGQREIFDFFGYPQQWWDNSLVIQNVRRASG